MNSVALAEVAECLDRMRVPVKESERVPGPVPYYGANGQQGWIDKAIFDEPLVIVAEDGGHFGEPERGVAYRISGPSWVNNHGHVLRATPKVAHDYLFHALRNFNFAPYISGSTRSKLTQKQLMQAEIPLPSLPEQRRIATILDHADALRAKRHQALTRLDSLTQSVFYDMFGDPDESTDNVDFGAVANLSGGRNLVADDSAAQSPFRVLKISAVTTGQFKAGESKPLPPDYVPPTKHLVRAGDLLMSRANTTELVGAVAYVSTTPPNLALPDKVWRFEWKEDAEPVFYHALFSTPAVRRRISRLSSGTGGSMKNVSKSKLATMPLPQVALSLQRDFVARAQQGATQRALLKQAADEHDQLFASLQSRAFAGAL